MNSAMNHLRDYICKSEITNYCVRLKLHCYTYQKPNQSKHINFKFLKEMSQNGCLVEITFYIKYGSV